MMFVIEWCEFQRRCQISRLLFEVGLPMAARTRGLLVEDHVLIQAVSNGISERHFIDERVLLYIE